MNSSGIRIENDDDLNLSEFSTEFAEEMDSPKKMAAKMKSLETKLASMNVQQQVNQAADGGPSMMQMGWQFGEKYGELKKEVEKFSQENGQLKKEIEGMKMKMEAMAKDMEGMLTENAGLKEANGLLKKEMTKMMEELKGKIEENYRQMGQEVKKLADKLEGNGHALDGLKTEIGEKLEQKAEKLANFCQRKNEMEARFKVELIKMDGNKFGADCRSKLAISEWGLVFKHSGPYAWNSVRAQMAFPKFNLNANKPLIAYFEVEIVANPNSVVRIGFCTQEFPLEGTCLGSVQNSIGIWHKEEICIDGTTTNFGNKSGYFKLGEVIGIGIVHYPTILAMKCFATCNGNLLGMIDLPIKFADLHLFPAVSMYNVNDSIRANLETEGFRYNPCEILQNL